MAGETEQKIELVLGELIPRLQEFIEKTYYAELAERVRKGERSLTIDFQELVKFDVEVADMLLDNPEEVLRAGEIAVEQMPLTNTVQGFQLRVKNLPQSAKMPIRHLRSNHLEKFLVIEGVVRNKGTVRPQVTSARFECPSCGTTLTVLQLDTKFKEPTRCSCGRKGKFKLLSKELVDAQGLILEEIPEQIEGSDQPKRINLFLKNDLVSPLTERRTNPGARIIVTGILKEVPQILRTGGQSTRFEILFEVNAIETVEEDFSDISITQEEKEKILELSKDPKMIKKMVSSLAPSIYGHEKIKEALLLQLVGGVKKQREGGMTIRGDIHVMLVGDPGSAKSQLLKRLLAVAPKARYIVGRSASGAGLSATVVKDEFLQGWSLEAGALVLANKGHCLIDELDKMSTEDMWAMHEALEQQSITVSKANIQATLRAETTVLAAANPKFGRFDQYDTIANQINLPPTLINRFDLIFPIKDVPEAGKDERMASFILSIHKKQKTDVEIETSFLRKYLAYVRQNIFPTLTDEAIDELKNYFVTMRSSAAGKEAKAIPISARQLEGLVRLAEASAKIHLRNKVTKKDAGKAIELLDFCLRQVAFDEETGVIDIDRIATSMPAAQRNKIIIVKEIIADLESKIGKTVPVQDIMQAADEKGLSESETEEILQKLKRSGDIFEPRHGFISKI